MNQRLGSLGARTLVAGLVVGFLAGLLLAGYRLSNYDVGRRLVLLPVLAKSVNQAVLVAVPLFFLWVADDNNMLLTSIASTNTSNIDNLYL